MEKARLSVMYKETVVPAPGSHDDDELLRRLR